MPNKNQPNPTPKQPIKDIPHKISPELERKIKAYQAEFSADTPIREILIHQLAVIALKIEQLQPVEDEFISTQPLDPAILQNKPSPLVKVTKYQTALQKQFDAILKQLQNKPTPR